MNITLVSHSSRMDISCLKRDGILSYVVLDKLSDNLLKSDKLAAPQWQTCGGIYLHFPSEESSNYFDFFLLIQRRICQDNG
jgi:hypothetical protein